MVDETTPQEWMQRQREAVKQAMDSFPYETIQVASDQALATWQRIRELGRGSPVVIGNNDDFERIVQGVSAWPAQLARKTCEQILDAAALIRHPEELTGLRTKVRERALDLFKNSPKLPWKPQQQPPPGLENFLGGTWRSPSREEIIASLQDSDEPPIGEWPSEPVPTTELTVATDTLTGNSLHKVNVVIVPTDDWTTIPAYLHWGNWNGCPAPEYHVAALRSWRDRFGAELVGLSHDVMNIRVKRRPATREVALDLAREQYVYCPDIVDQGTENLSSLAAVLMASDWWYFWWD